MLCLSRCRFSEWQPAVSLDKTQENKPIPFPRQDPRCPRGWAGEKAEGRAEKTDLEVEIPGSQTKDNGLRNIQEFPVIALAAPPPPRQQPLSKRALTIPSIFNNPYRTYFNFFWAVKNIESSLCMFEPGGEDWGAATCCSGHDQPFHLAGGQPA